MDILELDKQLKINLKRFNNILNESEVILREATNLAAELKNEANEVNEYFENQTIGLRDAYKKRLKQLESEFKQEKETFSGNAQEFNEYYIKIVTLFEKLDAEKKEFDLFVGQFNKTLDKRWKDFDKENTKTISSLEHKISNRIDVLSELHNELKEQFDVIIGSFNSQVARLDEENNLLQNKIEKTELYAKAIYKRHEDDYEYFKQKYFNMINILKIGFGISGLLFIVILVGWILK
jgi:hypothetical protein